MAAKFSFIMEITTNYDFIFDGSLVFQICFIISDLPHKTYGSGAALGQGSKITFLFNHFYSLQFWSSPLLK